MEERRPRLLFLAFGFPPAAKSSAHRLREIANQFAALDWDVTVVNAARETWESDHGLDLSMLDHVDPRVRLVELPVRRPELETDIRTFSRSRAQHPARWLRAQRERNLRSFPEPAFGGWRTTVEDAVLDLHREEPFDLVIVSCVPYVLIAAALRLHREYGVPYAVDFRDGWSIDVVAGEVAFEKDSELGRWETEALESAESLWVVNDPIAEHYRTRYPHLADRIHVVRNGFDPDSIPGAVPARKRDEPLRFGYLGVVNVDVEFLKAVLGAWREARASDPRLAGATLDIRGHVGSGASRETNGIATALIEARADGVRFGGPVKKSEVGAVYAGWDALVLILIGGGFMTSGKVYEFMATGLPIVSAHAPVHDASSLLQGYPLWTGAQGLDHDHLVRAFGEAAGMALEAGPERRAAAREHAARYDRRSLMCPAVNQLAARVTSR